MLESWRPVGLAVKICLRAPGSGDVLMPALALLGRNLTTLGYQFLGISEHVKRLTKAKTFIMDGMATAPSLTGQHLCFQIQ